MKYEALAMTIAGSDSGGGAGLQADLKTFQTFNVYGTSALTSVTAQNTTGVRSVENIKPEVVGDQIDMIMEDMGCDAAKTGMVSNKDIIEVISNKIQKHALNKLVVDPVMVAKSGARLLNQKAENTLIEKLVPLAYLLTPNIPEAELLSGLSIGNKSDMKVAAKKIHDLGPSNILVKGGRLEGEEALDIFYNGRDSLSLSAKRIDSKNTHGTGCTSSAAITACLAKGYSIVNSIKIAKEFISRSIENAPKIGQGYGPLYHKTEPKNIEI